jgi:hypothetical protein
MNPLTAYVDGKRAEFIEPGSEHTGPSCPRSPYYLSPNTPEVDRVVVPLDQNTFGCLCSLQTIGESQEECIRRLIWEAWRAK